MASVPRAAASSMPASMTWCSAKLNSPIAAITRGTRIPSPAGTTRNGRTAAMASPGTSICLRPSLSDSWPMMGEEIAPAPVSNAIWNPVQKYEYPSPPSSRGFSR